ncbi:lipoyl synthase [Bacteroidota bacterium]
MRIKEKRRQKPDWLKIKLPGGEKYSKLKGIIQSHGLHTICTSGKCPNAGECWNDGTATFMILGEICTRSCKFCSVISGKPLPPDPNEPDLIAKSIKLMELKHAVITSVDRDDLEDGGAEIWAKTINKVKELNPSVTLEVLIPDFGANINYLQKIIETKPEIISHNLETIKRLTPLVRSRAEYYSSLKIINWISESGIVPKSGIMLGLGETYTEVLELMDDLIEVGCKVFTIGQYLQPSDEQLEVVEFVRPELFEKYKNIGLEKGFKIVESGPLVRSSYHAEKHII